MRDETGLPDDPTTGDVGEAVSVELPIDETPAPPTAPAPGPVDVLDQVDVTAPDLLNQPEVVVPAVSSRWFPETLGGVLYLLVLVAAVVAVGVVWFSDWRVGVRIFAGALFAAAAFRLALPSASAGMLGVRSRGVDVLMQAGVAALLVFLAGSIPDQP